MAIIKCKMCGGDLNISGSMTVAECEYCGTKQTIPAADNEKKLTLFSRANRLRLACEFDKAAGVYESIVADFPIEAEAYWGLVLCRYGIEYVDDPATGKKVPTCHRSSFNSILEDNDFEQACDNADAVARRVYRDEAKAIEQLRRGIVEISGKEDPYDIFICYKETGDDGQRTLDSVLAQDVYDALTEKGYRVFFSRITLEDKLGQEYEPYIFAALHSAKLMLTFGTDFEHFNAVWVKNEWSRYLKLMTHDKSKHLIPCYKNIDAYDMPKEFVKLQAQDMGKVGAIQDLLRGIDKILPKNTSVEQQMAAQSGGPNMNALLKRGYMALEDGDRKKAVEYFEQVLDMDAECSDAYLGKAVADLDACAINELGYIALTTLTGNRNFQRALQYADIVQKEQLETIQRYALQVEEREKEHMKRKAEECKKQEEEQRTKEEQQRAQNTKRLASARKKIAAAATCISAGWSHTIGLKSDGTVLATGDNDKGKCSVQDWQDIIAVTVGTSYTIGLKSDGTVEVAGNLSENYQNAIRIWRNIVAVSSSKWDIVGLKSDNTVVTVEHDKYGQRNAQNWRDIVATIAGRYPAVGLMSYDSEVTTESSRDNQLEVQDWKDIVSISTGCGHLVGLKSDGTVLAVGLNNAGQCRVQNWRDIVAIAAGFGYTVGLKSDGMVLAAGLNNVGQCNVQEWQDIVAISARLFHTIGLKSDGTVVAVGENNDGQCNIQEWQDIVAISAGEHHTVGLKSDGTVVATGYNYDERCNVQNWRLFKSIDILEQDRIDAKPKWEEERIRRAEELERDLEFECGELQAELTNIKGPFAGMRRKQIETRLAMIEAELKKQ